MSEAEVVLTVEQGAAGTEPWVVSLSAQTLTALENAEYRLPQDQLDALIAAFPKHVVNETPSGLVDGSNVDFTTDYAYKSSTTRLFLNGLRQSDPANYLETGANTLRLQFVPQPGDVLTIDYIQL